jgi:hypothetical protein
LVGALYLVAGQMNATPEGWILYPLRPPQGQDWMWIAWIVLGAIGVIVQIATQRKTKRA